MTSETATYNLTYSRVGNAKPVYALRDENGNTYLFRTVEDIRKTFPLPMKTLKLLCKQAREEAE